MLGVGDDDDVQILSIAEKNKRNVRGKAPVGITKSFSMKGEMKSEMKVKGEASDPCFDVTCCELRTAQPMVPVSAFRLNFSCSL